MEFDHLFLRARPGAPEADLLRAAGFAEGSGNTHPGQGTANRRFFFENGFIELLWIADEAEVRGDATRRTMLHERLDVAGSGASPFGICFRPHAGATAVPFSTWAYRPGYLPAGMAIDIADDIPLHEPMWFFFGRGAPPRGQPLDHANGVRAITQLTVTLPGAGHLSDAARAAVRTGRVAFVEGDTHLLEIEFDHGATGHRQDFRPGLPLIVRY